jgi:hypothetical protein
MSQSIVDNLHACREAAHRSRPQPNLDYRGLVAGVRGAASDKPPFRSITIIGHQFVKADWNRFTPTNNVNHRKLTFT